MAGREDALGQQALVLLGVLMIVGALNNYIGPFGPWVGLVAGALLAAGTIVAVRGLRRPGSHRYSVLAAAVYSALDLMALVLLAMRLR